MKFAIAALVGLSQADYTNYYTGRDSTWYSSSLDRDTTADYTSYDYTYRNSYSYDSANSEVYKWDYAYDAWNISRSYYDGSSSTWYASTLRDDGPGYTSYDYTYRNSYSYDSSASEVYKWDYAYNGWNITTGSVTPSSGGSYSYYTGEASTWYSSSLSSDAAPSRAVGGTSYDYTYRNSYSYDANQGVFKWDYAYNQWNTTRSYYTGGDSTWYSSTLVDDGPGYTSYDYTYRNSYSYGNGQVYKWDYSINAWNMSSAIMAATPYAYSYYTGHDSQWYSATLDSDSSRAIGGTSYDYTYRNSYSYSSGSGEVFKWDYARNAWNTTVAAYDGSQSTWYSSTLQRDSYADYTSYDWTYMNSYSYDTSTNDVLKWDYAYNGWNLSSTQMGGFLVGGPYKPEIQGETLLAMAAKPFGVKPANVESPFTVAILLSAIFSIFGVIAYKYKKVRAQKALNNSAFERQSEAVDNVMIA